MNTELNSPREMLRRLVFAVVLVCAVAAFWLLASQIVGLDLHRLLAAVVCAGVAAAVYAFGRRRLAFDSIQDTLIFLNLPPRLRPELHADYRRAETLIAQLRDVALDPWDRQELRNELSAVVTAAPRLFELLREDILAVHPAIRPPAA